MAGTMTYGGLSAEQYLYYYEMRLLLRAVANFAYAYVAQQGFTPESQIPKNRGDTIHWRKIGALEVATTPLNEGETPAGTDLTVTSTTGTVQQYGSFVRYTDMLTWKSIDPILTGISAALGEQAGNTIDVLTRDVAVATTNVLYSAGTGRTDIAATDVLTTSLLLKGIRTLEDANALPIKGDRYIAIISPKTWFDLRQDSKLWNIMEQVYPRGTGNPLLSGYLGTAYGIDFYKSTNAKVYTSGGKNSNDVHATMLFGRDALGIGGLASMMPTSIRGSQWQNNTGERIMPVSLIDTPPSTPDKDDPLRQRGSIGWKTTFVAKLLNEDFLVKLEHGVTG